METFVDILAVMPAAFVMTLVLTGIHGYLGLHVIERKVIFVDLALAQIAALGGIFAMWLGYDLHGDAPGHAAHTLALFEWLGLPPWAPSDEVMIYLFSLAFALGGAAVFALTRTRRERVPQEAFIGVSFATAIALALLLLERLGGGGEHVRNMLARDALMFATWPQVVKTAALYGAIGVVHWVFRDRFFAITADAEAARARGLNVRWWDFLFYATFGLVITSSVAIAGVLLVFTYLVVPAAIALLFARRTSRRIAWAWGAGFAASVLGMLVTAWDNVTPPGSPPAPWIVTVFAGMLLAAGALGPWVERREVRRSLVRLAGAGAAVALLFGLGALVRKEAVHEHAGDPVIEALAGGPAARLRAIDRIGELADPHYVGPLAELLLEDPEPAVVERAVRVLGRLGRGAPAALEGLRHTARRDLDPTLRVAVARALAQLGDAAAIAVLLEVLTEDLPPFDREEAWAAAAELTGRGGTAYSAEAAAALRAWYRQHEGRLVWSPAQGHFAPRLKSRGEVW